MSVIQKVVVNVTQPKKRRRVKKKKVSPRVLSGQIGKGWVESSAPQGLPPIRLFPQNPPSLMPNPASFGLPQPPINMYFGGGATPALNYQPMNPANITVTEVKSSKEFGAFDENAVHSPTLLSLNCLRT
jgi:hypothetical protein